MTPEETAVAIAEIGKEIGSLKHRMNDVEQIVQAVHGLALEMAAQTTEIRHMNKSLAEVKGDVAELKAKPASRWERVIETFIGAIAGAAAALFLK